MPAITNPERAMHSRIKSLPALNAERVETASASS